MIEFKNVRKLRVFCTTAFMMLSFTGAFAQDELAAIPGETTPAMAQEADPSAVPLPQQNDTNRIKKNYIIPAVEIVGFNFGLNRFDYRFLPDTETFDVSWSSVRRNLKSDWVVDADPFAVNQFLHPYHGGIYHTTARSAGLRYWEAAIYTMLGSALWEIAGETEPPSVNDQVASGIGGSYFGEALFRMASLTLEKSTIPRFWRAVSSTGISPMTSFNRLAFGDRFDPIFPGNDPAHFMRWNFGSIVAERRVQGTSRRPKQNEALADLSFTYGMPGQPGYTYQRPFDYFTFEFGGTTSNGLENVMTRGLLHGKEYGSTTAYRGVWGLYGSYDYIAPDVFRVSSTAFSLGTTGQWRLSGPLTFQGTALAGVGYGAGGTLEGTTEDRDYHYGLTPQSLLSLRLVFGKVASLDLAGRGYRITRTLSTADRGWENVGRADASLTMRLFGPHAITVKYLVTRRYASYPDLGVRDQRRDTLSVFYTLVRDRQFGVVDGRAPR